MKDNCSYRFDAILAVALEQDARQELAALPTPAALKELYPDTSSLDARITRALHTLHHPQKVCKSFCRYNQQCCSFYLFLQQ